jgi:hypothetical protein
MIIKVSFAAAAATAAGSNPQHGTSSSLGSGSRDSGGGKIALFQTGRDNGDGSCGNNIVDSGISKKSEFFPEAA